MIASFLDRVDWTGLNWTHLVCFVGGLCGGLAIRVIVNLFKKKGETNEESSSIDLSAIDDQ
jgi:hypothetical protein